MLQSLPSSGVKSGPGFAAWPVMALKASWFQR